MTLVATGTRDEFNSQLVDEITRQLGSDAAAPIADFALAFHATFPLEDLEGRQLSDIYALTHGWWKFVQEHDVSEAKISVCNPTLEEDGWQSPHTILMVLHRDMPFLVDSIRIELDRRDVAVHTINTCVFRVERGADHRLVSLFPKQGRQQGDARGSDQEAAIFMEIGRTSGESDRVRITDATREVLADVQMVVRDFRPMLRRVSDLLDSLGEGAPVPDEEKDEARSFVSWMLDNHFTFLGISEYEIVEEGGSKAVREIVDKRLGLLHRRRERDEIEYLHEMPPQVAQMALEKDLLGFSKSSVRSRVHRSAYSDYVTVKHFDAQGEVGGETRIMGLYTSTVYSLSPLLIPVVREKVARAMDRSGFVPEGHESKDLQHVLEGFPRDELFQSSSETLFETAMAVVRIQERRQVRLFVRRDAFLRFFSCIVYMPRNLYNTEVRQKVEHLLCDAFGAEEAEFTTHLSESILARTHFIIRVDPEASARYDVRSLQRRIVDIVRTWEDQLRDALVESLGEEEGTRALQDHERAFPPSYRDAFEPRIAVRDIETMATLRSETEIAMAIYRPVGQPGNSIRFKLFHLGEMLPLSDVLPILENLGLRVVSENTYAIRRRTSRAVWMHDFDLAYGLADSIDLHHVKVRFEGAFESIWHGEAESDGLNRLILGTRLTSREVTVLRAYARYMKQISFPFSLRYIADTLSRHFEIAERILALFRIRFDPDLGAGDQEVESQYREQERRIIASLDAVESLNEDRILRRYVDLIGATLRTNYYQTDPEGRPQHRLSFKLDSGAIPDMPRPRPMCEIFVYTPRVEGIHLRGGKVARGGIRWSDRQEDLRTEILGLMKAQQVKNAVIVPVGAKGGFVTRNLPAGGTPEEIRNEGIACYRTFIEGLLDVTDNLEEGAIAAPPRVVRRDGDDPYLVVAADKGTATFSDIANEISTRRGFWLGDAFASGGSVGYDHKQMGITARSAWIGVQRHFRERGIDVQEQDTKVVGIGDMAGDVFGNGMLLSRHIRLVAAFNHQHVFLDPDPDPETSYLERRRLFDAAGSSWADYDAGRISKGGGVHSRAAKSIPLSPEVRRVLGIDAEAMTPNELIPALLRAPVDLLWNGGIGTYVKSSLESHPDVGDKKNDAVRINANELRCRVIGEGGNLGLTQLARVEYGLLGGAVNADFIDNVGGVNCSDREVNIKILLNALVASGDLLEKRRRALLEEMTEDVADLVLQDSYRQVQAISIAESQAARRMGEHERYISFLEAAGKLDRALEFLPSDETLADRRVEERGLLRPELAILISYTKVDLKQELLDSDVVDDEYVCRAGETAFPARLLAEYGDAAHHHRLRREIAATQIANDLVNRVGFTFVQRLQTTTGASTADIVRAYVAARDTYGMEKLWRRIEALDQQVAVSTQLPLMRDLMRLGRLTTRWFLRNREGRLDVADEVRRFGPAVGEIVAALPECLDGRLLEGWRARQSALRADGIPEDLAHWLAGAGGLRACLTIVEAAEMTGASPTRVAGVFYGLGERLDLDWLGRLIVDMKVNNHWEARARESAIDDLDRQQRTLTVSLLRSMGDEPGMDSGIARWKRQHGAAIWRWTALLKELHASSASDIAMITVALGDLGDLARACRHESDRS